MQWERKGRREKGKNKFCFLYLHSLKSMLSYIYSSYEGGENHTSGWK
jgi:hypothetical protein